LESVGFDAAPRVLGIDERGREILTYLEGETVGDDDPRPAWWRDDDTLVQAIMLLRRFHSEGATFNPPSDALWRFEGSGDPGVTIVRGDWAPYNVVWRRGAVVGVIDWDLARPAIHSTTSRSRHGTGHRCITPACSPRASSAMGRRWSVSDAYDCWSTPTLRGSSGVRGADRGADVRECRPHRAGGCGGRRGHDPAALARRHR
jgi:hypothetical protein